MANNELLRQLQVAVEPHVQAVTLRGEGCSSFLFIEDKGAAIEASRHENQWWLEFWTSQQEDDAPPAKEMTVATSEEARTAIIDWLLRSGQPS